MQECVLELDRQLSGAVTAWAARTLVDAIAIIDPVGRRPGIGDGAVAAKEVLCYGAQRAKLRWDGPADSVAAQINARWCTVRATADAQMSTARGPAPRGAVVEEIGGHSPA